MGRVIVSAAISARGFVFGAVQDPSALPLHTVPGALLVTRVGPVPEQHPWRRPVHGTVVPNRWAPATVSELRCAPGDSVLVGGQTLWGALIQHGLVDELQLLVDPGLDAGDGRVIRGLRRSDLCLVAVRPADASGALLLRYSVRECAGAVW